MGYCFGVFVFVYGIKMFFLFMFSVVGVDMVCFFEVFLCFEEYDFFDFFIVEFMFVCYFIYYFDFIGCVLGWFEDFLVRLCCFFYLGGIDGFSLVFVVVFECVVVVFVVVNGNVYVWDLVC